MTQIAAGRQPGLPKVIPLERLFRRLRRGRLLIIFCVIAGVLFGIVFLLVTPKSYTVVMLVAPPLENMSQRESIEGGALASVGLASLASAVSPEPFRRYESLLKSQVTAQALQRHHHILQMIYANRWDAHDQRWLPKTGLTVFIKRMLNIPTPDPNVVDIMGFLESNVAISSPSITSPVREIRLRYSDPEDAVKIMLWLHGETDAAVRTGTLARTRGMIQYLKQQLPVVDNADERLALSRLLVEREQDLMLLVVGLDYSAVIIDPPNPDAADIYPHVKLVLAFGFLLGLGIGILIVLTRLDMGLVLFWRRMFAEQGHPLHDNVLRSDYE